MLLLCLTVSALLWHQITGNAADEVNDLCENIDCPEPTKVIQYDNYEEMEYPAAQWIETTIDGMDMDNIKSGLDKLVNYSFFSNAEGTIISVSAPLGVIGSLVDGKIQQKFRLYLIIPADVINPPDPTDQAVKIRSKPAHWFYVRVFDKNINSTQYAGLVFDFLEDLEQDKRSFDRSFFSFNWYHRRDLIEIVFAKKEE